MPNLILTAVGWETRIRSKMGIDIAYLPDADLGQPDIIDVAEANIIEQIPDYASKTGTDKIYLEAATVLECAVLLCPSMPARLPKQSESPHVKIMIDTDWNARQEGFEGERDANILKILKLPNMPHFGLSR